MTFHQSLLTITHKPNLRNCRLARRDLDTIVRIVSDKFVSTPSLNCTIILCVKFDRLKFHLFGHSPNTMADAIRSPVFVKSLIRIFARLGNICTLERIAFIECNFNARRTCSVQCFEDFIASAAEMVGTVFVSTTGNLD